MIGRVIERTGETVLTWGAMYKAVAHSVFLYKTQSWVVTGGMLKFLTTFQNRAARCTMGIIEKHGAGV